MEIIVDHAFSARHLDHWSEFGMGVTLNGVPGSRERTRILDMNIDFKRLAALDDPETFDDMQFVAMRRAVIVDPGLVVQPDGIDDESVVFKVTNRFAKP